MTGMPPRRIASRTWFAVAILAAVAGMALLMGGGVKLAPPCPKPISREEALSAGIAAIYEAHLNSNYVGLGSIGKHEPVVYQDIADFLARNPDCCSFKPLGEDDFAPTPKWRDRYDFYGFAYAKFQAYWLEEAGERRTMTIERSIVVTTCGKTIWYDVDDDYW